MPSLIERLDEKPNRAKGQKMPTLPIAAISAVGYVGFVLVVLVTCFFVLHTSEMSDSRVPIFPASTCYAIEGGDCAFQVLAASGADLTVWGSFPQGCSDKEATVRPTSRATLPNLLLPYRSSASEPLIHVATSPGYSSKARTLLN
jgi:hypothetical protein